MRLHLLPEKSPHIQELCRLLTGEQHSLSFSQRVAEALERLPHEQPEALIFDAVTTSEEQRELHKLVEQCEIGEVALLPVVNGQMAFQNIDLLNRCPCLYYPFQRQDVLFKLENETKIRQLQNQILRAHDTLIETRAELQASFESAAYIQRSLLPQRPPEVQHFQFSWHFLPCDHQSVGGDLFNVMQLDEHHLAAYVLDVSGHGFPAAMVTVSISQSLSPKTGQVVKQGIDDAPYYRISTPGEVLGYLNNEYPLERFEKFFTMCYAVFDMRTGLVRYSNAGHPLPVLIRREGSVVSLTERGTIIGLLDSPYPEGEILLRPGDRLFFYTDGIIEYQNGEGEFFGEERLYNQLSESIEHPLNNACSEIIDALTDFADGLTTLQDDITLLGVEFCGPSE